MSDIFLSHLLEDSGKAGKLRAAFQQQGWTVFSWNPLTLTFSGSEVMDKEFKDAKVIVALWSRLAAHRSSVIRETLERFGPAPTILVRLDKLSSPPPMSHPEFDLSDWDGGASHGELTSLLTHVRAAVAASSSRAAPPASLDELSLSEIRESARRGIKESGLSPPREDAPFSGVFISYRRAEAAAYAGRLYDRLAARFGRERVFIDTENIGWGEDFVEAITSAAESCAVMIALISRQWSRGKGGQEEVDDYVRLEVATALGRKIRVIPILIQGASMPAPKDLPEDLSPLARRNALALDDTRWERDVEDLTKTLEKLLGG